MAADKFGIWPIEIGGENGDWLLGSNYAPNHPGYIAPDDERGLLVKYFKARQDDESGMYVGDGHARKTPAHPHPGGERLEGVEVLDGCLYWNSADGRRIAVTDKWLEHPSEAKPYIELRPNDKGTWHLQDSKFARGVTIVRRQLAVPVIFGSGTGYRYKVLDSVDLDPAHWSDAVNNPSRLDKWLHRLIMVFRGELTRCEGTTCTHRFDSQSVRGAYVPRGAVGVWLPSDQVRTVMACVYY